MSPECLRDCIELPRLHPDGIHPENFIHSKCKMGDYYHLYHREMWLRDGNFYRTQEAETGLGTVDLLLGHSSCSVGACGGFGGLLVMAKCRKRGKSWVQSALECLMALLVQQM
jgi:hypothetical protein